MKNKKIIIIGGGIGGLATAALLGRAGYSVTIFEKNTTVGGKARIVKGKGFTFDMGPSWYLMPDVFERYYALFNKKPEDFFTLKKLQPAYRMFFSNNKIIDVHNSLKKNIQLFKKIETDGDVKLKNYVDEAKYKYTIAVKSFLYKEYKNITDFFTLQTMIDGAKLKVFESIEKHVNRYFTSDFAKKILEYNIVFLGGNPQNTPALYSIMAHVDFNLGVWYPMGGMHKVVESLKKLAIANGVKIHCNSTVSKIIVNDGKAEGIMVNNNIYTADAIIANADYPHVEMHLLEKRYQSYSKKYWDKKVIAPSAFIIYLGVKGKIKRLKHHNLFVENDWMKHFDQIFKNPSWPQNFSYYVSCPTKTDSSVAPKDHENIFILVPIAPNITDSKTIRDAFYAKVLTLLQSSIGQNIEKQIVFRKIYSLNEFKNDYNAYHGSALGLTHTLFQSAIFRPKMRSKKVENLFYVGQYTHPGIGVPMVLIAAEIMLDIIKKKYD